MHNDIQLLYMSSCFQHEVASVWVRKTFFLLIYQWQILSLIAGSILMSLFELKIDSLYQVKPGIIPGYEAFIYFLSKWYLQ